MRTDNSKKSAITAIFANVIKILIGFFSQRVFVFTLGTEFLGLNGLFNNIITMLAMAEMGIGSAIIFNLYEPIAADDKIKIKQLMDFYQKAYNVIGIIILIIGICLTPILPYFVGEDKINGLTIFFLLFLMDTVLSYRVAYKSSLINAYQKNYIINLIHILYLLFMNILQIAFLLLTKAYIIYLLLRLIARLLENGLINKYFRKNYNYLDCVPSTILDETLKEDITTRVKAMMLHKMATFCVAGTDNLIISKFLGLTMVGLYSNYSMIFSSVRTLLEQMFNSVISSIGNLLTEKNKDKSYMIYERVLFLDYWITCFCAITLFFLIKPFVSLWLGNAFVLDSKIVFVLVLVFYSQCMRSAPSIFKSAGGMFVEDKLVPVIESLLNLVFSIFLVKRVGLIGVFIGTLISSMILHLYSYPQFVYKKILGRKAVGYVCEQLKYFFMFMMNFGIVYGVVYVTKIEGGLYRLIGNFAICLAIPNLINCIVYHKSEYFKYYLGFLNKTVKVK